VTILETKVPRVWFPDATDEQQEALAAILVENISNQEITFSLDRVLTMLDLAEHQRQAVDGFDTTHPKIKFVDYPAILVTIDGEPQLVDVEGQASMKRVVNSAFMIILAGRNYYLYARQDKWYVSAQVLGTWEISEHVPTAVQRLAPSEEEKEARERAEAAAPAAEDPGEEPELGTAMLATPTTIIMAAEPTELIVTEGAPEYNPSALIFSMSTTVKATCSSRSRPSVTSFYCLGAGSRRPDSTVPGPSSLPIRFPSRSKRSRKIRPSDISAFGSRARTR